MLLNENGLLFEDETPKILNKVSDKKLITSPTDLATDSYNFL